MPKLTINGQEIEVEKGTSLLQAAEMLGFEIPRFCYHDRLSVPANCRMCLVEVKGAPKPVASCAMAAGDDMEVLTDSEMVHKARKGVMEFLLINHPLDCPICDQGGECDLQDQAMGYGFDRSRYHENKRAVPNKNIGPLIKTIMTRCIHCTRCVRFGEEVAGVEELGLLHRGEDVEIGTFIERAVTTELSGNMIDICPVGALTSKPYAFQARPWELRRTDTVDVHDAVGSNIRADARGGEVMRILPRLHEEVNEEWINDRTRFAYDGLKRQRLDRPHLRDDNTGKLRPAEWEEVFARCADRLKHADPAKIGALAGDLQETESIVALKDLMATLGVQNLDCRVDGEQLDTSCRAGYLFNTGIARVEESDAILIVGANPRWEATLVNTRIRRNWLDNRVKVGLVGDPVDLTYPYKHLGTGPGDLEALLKGDSPFADILDKADKPMIILGTAGLRREDGPHIQALAREVAEKYGMIRDGWNGFNILHHAAARVAGLDTGFVPQGDKALDMQGMFDAGQKGNLDVLYLLGVDNFDVREKVGDETFVIYQGHHGDRGAMAADVILPGAAYTEKEGLYVNTEGRVQYGITSVFPPGKAQEDWKILRALSEYTGEILGYDTLFDLRERIEREWPHLKVIDMKPDEKWGKFGGAKSKIKTAPFAPLLDNFYMTNVITRASQTMAQCTQAFLNAGGHAAEAAE